MKKLLYISVSAAVLALAITSCNTNDDGSSYYKPAEYVFNDEFTIKIDNQSVTDNTANAIYTPTAIGKGHVAVLRADQPAPSATTIFSKNYKGAKIDTISTFDFDVTKDTPYTVEIEGLYGDYDYTLYAIHETVDGFITEQPLSLTFTTVDTQDPTFFKDKSTPKNDSVAVSPFDPITLEFSEPVYYEGGDIIFTGAKGRVVTINDKASVEIKNNAVIIKEHGTFPQSDKISVTWADGTFKDKAEKNVAALNNGEYSFKTRAFTTKEIASLMVGEYNYTTTFNGSLEQYHTNQSSNGDYPTPTGKFELTLDENDAEGTTLLGINIFSGEGASEPQKFKITLDTDGKIKVPESNVMSAITIDDINDNPQATEWGSHILNQVLDAGTYDLENGSVVHKKALFITGTSNIYDQLEYNYTRIGTYK